MGKWLLKPPKYEDFLHLLMAWRVWLVGAFAGVLIAMGFYLISPPPYRVCATVLVDHNVEQVILEEESDLRKYTYIQRESDKLVDFAWSDAVLTVVAEQTGIPVIELRDGRLRLSQPSDGGWHFYAASSDPETAAALAAAWAMTFSDQVQAGAAGISSLTEVNPVQVDALPVERSLSMGIYVFCGALAGVVLCALGVLFVGRKGE